MAFQADAFQNDAFQVLEKGYQLLWDMTPEASKKVLDLELRHLQGEANEDEVIDAVPITAAKGWVRSHLKDPAVILSLLIASAGLGASYIWHENDVHGREKSSQEHHEILQEQHRLEEQVRVLLDRLSKDHPQPPGHHPPQSP